MITLSCGKLHLLHLESTCGPKWSLPLFFKYQIGPEFIFPLTSYFNNIHVDISRSFFLIIKEPDELFFFFFNTPPDPTLLFMFIHKEEEEEKETFQVQMETLSKFNPNSPPKHCIPSIKHTSIIISDTQQKPIKNQICSLKNRNKKKLPHELPFCGVMAGSLGLHS